MPKNAVIEIHIHHFMKTGLLARSGNDATISLSHLIAIHPEGRFWDEKMMFIRVSSVCQTVDESSSVDHRVICLPFVFHASGVKVITVPSIATITLH